MHMTEKVRDNGLEYVFK